MNMYILSSRHGTELKEPLISTKLKILAETMQSEYKVVLSGFDSNEFDTEDTYCDEKSAIIAAKDDWYEWVISEIPLDPNDIEAIFRFQDRKYLREDAERALAKHLDVETDLVYGELSSDEAIPRLGMMSYNDFVKIDYFMNSLISEFESRQDAEIEDSVIWEIVVEKRLDEDYPEN